ncbi:MAG: SMC family ATPase [Clostridia bacterium]|nr:SMC family ATPase [Clostridia bacterium]
MKVKKLVMQAFGPYVKKIELDFTKLGDRGIYLITGDTGAGKTTIFDAITYALYGQASGDNREDGMLRSKYADPSDETFVELTFIYDSKEYVVRRSPAYMRPKKSGEGETLKPKEASLVIGDKVITRDITQAIEDIIGLDYSQFSKIAMLSQGEFQKVLLDSTKDRKAIFRSIFHTEKYVRFQMLMQEMYSKVEGRFNDIHKSIDQYLSQIEGEGKLEDLIKEDEALEKRFNKDISELSSDLEELTRNIQKGENQENLRKAIERDRAAIQNLEALTDSLKDALDKAKAGLEEAKEKRSQAAKLEARLSDYQQMDSVALQLGNIKRELERFKEEIPLKEKAKNKKEESLKEAKEKVLSLKDVETKKLQAKIELDELEKKEELEKKYDLAKEEYKLAKEALAQKKDEYDHKYMAYMDNQAGVLAEELEEGKPCRVCGSIHHPNIALKAENAPSKEELDSLRQSLDKALGTSQKASEKAGVVKAELEPLKAKHDGKVLDDVRGEYVAICADAEDKEELEKYIPKAEKELEDMKEAITLSLNIEAQHKAKIVPLEENLRSLRENLTYQDRNSCKKAIDELKERAAGLERDYQLKEKAFKDNEKDISTLKAKVDANLENLKKEKPVDLEAERDKKNLLSQKNRELSLERDQVTARLSKNKGLLENVEDKSKELKDTEDELIVLKSLRDTATGNLNGKVKIDFETFIQMNYLDRIVDRANVRLEKMTEGQYELVRRVDNEKKQGAGGLELDVKDYYNLSQRSVGSLSGGEKFKASLSLALGLSDEVTESSGRIRVDTMFVDEGFGSLDGQSINQAIEALEQTTQGNKLIGIISHVEELKNRIDKKMVVTKNRDQGSDVHIIT